MRKNFKHHNATQIRYSRETKNLPMLIPHNGGDCEVNPEYIKVKKGWRVVCPGCGKMSSVFPTGKEAGNRWNEVVLEGMI